MKRNNIDIIIAVSLVLTTVIARIVNANMHLPNFVPIAAISLFSGAVVKEKRALAFLIPLLGQFLADVYFQLFTSIPGFYSLSGQLFNYAAIIGAAALGSNMKQIKPLNTLVYILGASTVFFLISNFGYFAGGWNGYTFSGLMKAYVDGLPFFKNTVISDLIGGILLFGGYMVAQQALVKKTKQAKA